MLLNISSLVGKTLVKVAGIEGGTQLDFHTSDGKLFRMYHEQDCCERVFLEDVCGDFNDIIGFPILVAYEARCDAYPGECKYRDCEFWTFYHISTVKGTVTLRWYGGSNGYYSVQVDFNEISGQKESG